MKEKTKIVFILATHWNTNNIKRIEEFISNGYTGKRPKLTYCPY